MSQKSIVVSPRGIEPRSQASASGPLGRTARREARVLSIGLREQISTNRPYTTKLETVFKHMFYIILNISLCSPPQFIRLCFI